MLYLQKQLAALAAAADEEQLEDTWLNLVHEMGVSFQNVVSEVNSSGVTVSNLLSAVSCSPCCSALCTHTTCASTGAVLSGTGARLTCPSPHA